MTNGEIRNEPLGLHNNRDELYQTTVSHAPPFLSSPLIRDYARWRPCLKLHCPAATTANIISSKNRSGEINETNYDHDRWGRVDVWGCLGVKGSNQKHGHLHDKDPSRPEKHVKHLRGRLAGRPGRRLREGTNGF